MFKIHNYGITSINGLLFLHTEKCFSIKLLLRVAHIQSAVKTTENANHRRMEITATFTFCFSVLLLYT